MTKPVRVIIVDDQEPFRSAARLVVQLTDGFEVVGEAGSGEEGVRMVEELEPDLVLMDIKMPGMDGLEATRQLVAGGASSKIVVLSTYAADEYEHLALDAGAIAFLSKSDFGPAELAAIWQG